MYTCNCVSRSAMAFSRNATCLCVRASEYEQVCACIRICTCTRTNTPACMYAREDSLCIPSPPHKNTSTHTHKPAFHVHQASGTLAADASHKTLSIPAPASHADTHARTHARTHTHTHTYTEAQMPPYMHKNIQRGNIRRKNLAQPRHIKKGKRMRPSFPPRPPLSLIHPYLLNTQVKTFLAQEQSLFVLFNALLSKCQALPLCLDLVSQADLGHQSLLHLA